VLSKLGAGALSSIEPHDEFLELCAVSTSGQLTEEEQKKLQEHLAVCQSCREVLRQYEAVVSHAIPAIAADEETQSPEPDPSWSQEQAEKSFFKRLAQDKKSDRNKFSNLTDLPAVPYRQSPFSNAFAWPQVWTLYAAGILLFLTLGFYAYRLSLQRSAGPAAVQTFPPLSREAPTSLEEQLSDAGHERELANAEIRQRDKTITDLRRQLSRQSGEIEQMRTEQTTLEADLRIHDASSRDLVQQGSNLTRKLDVAVNTTRALQEKVDSLTQQSAQDAERAKELERKANELTQLLKDREAALEQQDQLLAHDRDIRELMGARDLYITEVYDVARTGETKKPYGRLFYTRGKSLVFYAYDLDQQSEAKRANTFQAWGRRGPDQQQALNLGIFYEDNAARKRWMLKCDDPKTLAQIDGVFVTVEPNGGSHKPSGRSLLFAYLRIDPNHP
jgi:hypothetical protein